MGRRRNRTITQEQELEDLAIQTSTPSRSQRVGNTSPVDPVEELIDRLSGLGSSKPKFKPPKFSGDTDVELFISQFIDIAEANRWRDREATLHLRSCLEGQASSCGQGSDIEEITQDLRSRFGITPKQARTQLGQLQKKHKQSFHELGAEITRLIKLAYPTQTRAFQTETALETFNRAVNHRALQHHLLARPHTSISEAVNICNEFTQIEGGKTTVASLDSPEPREDSVSTQIQTMFTALQDFMASQTKAITDLAQGQRAKKEIKCFECGGPHLKRNCPQLPKQQPLNYNSPAQ
jgi:hypothetical protein